MLKCKQCGSPKVKVAIDRYTINDDYTYFPFKDDTYYCSNECLLKHIGDAGIIYPCSEKGEEYDNW